VTFAACPDGGESRSGFGFWPGRRWNPDKIKGMSMAFAIKIPIN
jgi:hypothetical protein